MSQDGNEIKMKLHKASGSPRRFICLYCRLEFEDDDELVDHVQKEHPYKKK